MPNPPPFRLLLVDHASDVREALRWALEETGYLSIVGEAGTGLGAISSAELLKPDLAIVDVETPDVDGFSVARALRALTPPPAVLLLTVHGGPTADRLAREAGAHGIIDKTGTWDTLIAAVRSALTL